MQVRGQRVQPGQLDHELLWLSVSLGGVFLAALWLRAGLPWPRCIFIALTGHPCLTCGATRAALQFFHGNMIEAMRWNPLVFAFFWGVVIFDIYAAFVLLTGAERLRISGVTPEQRQLIRVLVIAAVALNWIYLLANSARYA
jgi:hypothetical protein